MKNRVATLAIAMLLMAGLADAATIDSVEFSGTRVVKLKGAIDVGDYASMLALLDRQAPAPGLMQIDSPGGDPATAMALGRFARAALMSVTAGRQCEGECLLVWLGGTQRTAIGTIIAGGLNSSPEIRKYLEEMEVSAAGIELLLAPDRMTLTAEDTLNVFGRESPRHEAWLSGLCGGLKEQERSDWANIGALRALETSMSNMGMGGNNSMYIAGPETQAMAAAARELDADYISALESRTLAITQCRRSAVERARSDLKLTD